MTFWDILYRLPAWLVAGLLLVVLGTLLFSYNAMYPDRVKQFALPRGGSDTLQASFSNAKLTFTRYEVIGQQNNCVLRLDPPGSDHWLPATYYANGDPIPDQKLKLVVDGKFTYTLIGSTFDWDGERRQICHFSARWDDGPWWVTASDRFLRWIRSL